MAVPSPQQQRPISPVSDSKKYKLLHLRTFLAFLLGLYLGQLRSMLSWNPMDHHESGLGAVLARSKAVRSSSSKTTIRQTSIVLGVEEIPFRKTSHAGVQKQQFVEPFALPHLAGLSLATLRPGQTVEKHTHDSMHEFFYVLEGEADFFVCSEWNRVTNGTFVHIVPRCDHAIVVPYASGTNFKVLVGGVTLGD